MDGMIKMTDEKKKKNQKKYVGSSADSLIWLSNETDARRKSQAAAAPVFQSCAQVKSIMAGACSSAQLLGAKATVRPTGGWWWWWALLKAKFIALFRMMKKTHGVDRTPRLPRLKRRRRQRRNDHAPLTIID